MKEIKITGFQIKQVLKWFFIGIISLFILYCGYKGIGVLEFSFAEDDYKFAILFSIFWPIFWPINLLVVSCKTIGDYIYTKIS